MINYDASTSFEWPKENIFKKSLWKRRIPTKDYYYWCSLIYLRSFPLFKKYIGSLSRLSSKKCELEILFGKSKLKWNQEAHIVNMNNAILSHSYKGDNNNAKHLKTY